MKILRKGVIPNEGVFNGICSECNTIFECKKSELRPLPSIYSIISAYCPVCKSIVCMRKGEYDGEVK